MKKLKIIFLVLFLFPVGNAFAMGRKAPGGPTMTVFKSVKELKQAGTLKPGIYGVEAYLLNDQKGTDDTANYVRYVKEHGGGAPPTRPYYVISDKSEPLNSKGSDNESELVLYFDLSDLDPSVDQMKRGNRYRFKIKKVDGERNYYLVGSEKP